MKRIYIILISIMSFYGINASGNEKLEEYGYQLTDSDFLKAIKNQDAQAIDEFFKTVLVKKKKIDGKHILNYIIDNGDLDTFIKFLTSKVVAEKVKDEKSFHQNLLFFLIGTRKKDHAMALCQQFSIHQSSEINGSEIDLLYYSIQNEQLSIAKCLISKGASLESAKNLNSDILGAALRNIELDAFKYLIKKVDLATKDLKYLTDLARSIIFYRKSDESEAMEFFLNRTNIKKSDDLYHDLYMLILAHEKDVLISIINKSFGK